MHESRAVFRQTRVLPRRHHDCFRVGRARAASGFFGDVGDPPLSPASRFYFLGCIREAYDYLAEIFDDPEYFELSFAELQAMAIDRQAEIVEARLTLGGPTGLSFRLRGE
jgi:hypothetical protein